MNSDDFMIKISIQDGTSYLSGKGMGFTIHDSIHQIFPTLELVYPDVTGIALEFGSFMSGISLSTVIGKVDSFLENFWISVGRDTIKEAGSSPRLSGVLKVNAIHKSFFSKRDNPKISFIKKSASECVNTLFSEDSLSVENTNGTFSTYVYSDPYEFVKEVLIPCASNGSISPFVFYRDLSETLNFSSIISLFEGSPVASFSLKPNLSELEDESNVITAFLPFNENAFSVYPKMTVSGKFINPSQEIVTENHTIAESATSESKVPLISSGEKVYNPSYYGRQFNPDVSYSDINKGLAANAMKFVMDKALIEVPFNEKCIAGKVVELKIPVLDLEGNEQPSENFSGNWLIEQSFHTWNGESSRPFSKLVLCRPYVKPLKNSLLESKSFK